MHRLNPTGKAPSNAPTLSQSFTQRLLEKAQKRQTFKEFLFLLVVGFRNIFMGFFKIDTIQSSGEEKEE